MITRRQILQSAVAPMIVPSLVLGQRAGAVPPSDKIIFGGIGIGTRGAHDLSKLLKIGEVKFVAVCDVRDERREEIKSTVDQAYGDRDCRMYDDQYELLAREDIDAVLIATGDRWHALASILELGLPSALYQLPQVTGNEMSPATVTLELPTYRRRRPAQLPCNRAQ